ncbi:MAG TPA: hypothetical protein VNV85_17195 [Puia sp.]|jgi:hypothetical protein|nr:hypothetical protein [Puia sp.]
MNARFSNRFGYTPSEKEIAIREDAPLGLRQFIVQLVYDCGYQPSFCRRIICRVLSITPDRNNWTEYPNIEYEASQLIEECDWFFVYDIIEAFGNAIDTNYREEFQDDLNLYFKQSGIGWKIEYGSIEYRGAEEFETAIKQVETVLETAKLETAKTEIKEAIHDLSRRPVPDITGAIQHSLACLECASREITGDKKATLGDIIKKHPGIVPRPLDLAIEKIWGYSSEQGRHLREGLIPNFDEAELVVGLTATIAIYLGKKLGGKIENKDADFPF